MAVPARPVAGAVLDSAWGQVAHDAVVAMDIQAGQATGFATGGSADASRTITFARPFKAGTTPVVVVTIYEIGGPTNRPYVAKVNGVSATQFIMILQSTSGVGAALTFTANWFAYGERA